MEKYQNYTITLTPTELALVQKAARIVRLGAEQFLVAAARHTVAQWESHAEAILKMRAEEAELLGVKGD